MHARQWIGLAVGFAGIVMLVWPDITAGGAGGRKFALGRRVACRSRARAGPSDRPTPDATCCRADILGSAALQMIFGGAFMLIAGTAAGRVGAPVSFTPQDGRLAFVYLTIAGSLVAFAAFPTRCKHLDVAIVSLYTYVNPVIAVALGTLLLGEPFHMRMLVAAGVILIGMMTVRQGLSTRSARSGQG